jgi:hypothetical protein
MPYHQFDGVMFTVLHEVGDLLFLQPVTFDRKCRGKYSCLPGEGTKLGSIRLRFVVSESDGWTIRSKDRSRRPDSADWSERNETDRSGVNIFGGRMRRVASIGAKRRAPKRFGRPV